MKHPFLKSALIIGSVVALMSCSEETAVNIPSEIPGIADNPSNGAVATEACWVLEGVDTYLINSALFVTNTDGQVIGYYDDATKSIMSADGQPLAINVDLATLPFKQPGEAIGSSQGSVPSVNEQPTVQDPTAGTPTTPETQTPTQQQQQQNPSQNTTPSTPSNGGNTVTNPTATSSSSVKTPAASSSSQQQQQQQQQPSADGTCFDKRSNQNVKPYTEQVGPNGEKYAYKNDCTIDCWWDGSNNNCAAVTGGSSNNNTQQPKSSSSQQQQQQPKSSSSQQQQRSSSSQQQGGTTGGTISSNYTIKYINGGKSGSGYATRYWDCCEPHCAWPEHGGKASTCDAKGNKVQGGSTSMCDGGNAGICRNQFPIVVNDKLAFAFAATPGGENNCGKCFDLAFTGKGKYATDNHSKLVGKHLIVMSSNVGYDVAGGQFDVMIPGGGYGIFDGCSAKMGWGSQGSQYGGLLDQCEKESNYKASTYKSCLQKKCEASFSMDPQAKEGCLFMANWMEAAGNPLLEYKEVECPQELLDRF